MSFGDLEGERVKLQPIEIKHADPLFHCSRNEKLWEKLPIQVNTLDEMREFVQAAITGRESGEQFPYVVIDKTTSRIIGTTRYLTWYAEEVWRTRVNTEAKYLLLTQAFELWKAVRVELITTTDHLTSQKAIERIGATKEGVLRKKYNNRDYVIYSIIDDEWDAVKTRLETLLKQ
ncbi:GNAT family N-acetyltransferase [Paenibacillus camelliae]|uniref:GNAT family N-acetyltransferase n=1 Tax=Paenibacillus camelliae TaxID=512410 RepID=UPI00203D02D7|nr:GNAT family protein [Paenibacillus camelliae]MCM3633639.1 GNAT family N-acetyltransferase [Paenibacillus camelliae]